MGDRSGKREIPLLPLRGLLVYPSMVLHLDVGREKSVRALEQAMVDDNKILLATQEEVHIEEPEAEQIYNVGTVARVKQMLKLPNGTIRVLVEGLQRAKIEEYVRQEDFFQVTITYLEEESGDENEVEALMRAVLNHFEQFIKLSKKVSPETLSSVTDIEEPGRLADVIASHLPLKMRDKQEILETTNIKERLNILLDILNNEREVLELERKISGRVKKQMERTQRNTTCASK